MNTMCFSSFLLSVTVFYPFYRLLPDLRRVVYIIYLISPSRSCRAMMQLERNLLRIALSVRAVTVSIRLSGGSGSGAVSPCRFLPGTPRRDPAEPPRRSALDGKRIAVKPGQLWIIWVVLVHCGTTGRLEYLNCNSFAPICAAASHTVVLPSGGMHTVRAPRSLGLAKDGKRGKRR